MSQSLLNLVLALATAELLHNLMETTNVRNKVARLQAHINKQPAKEIPINIDTRPKAYALTLASFIILVGGFYLIFSVINLQGDTALWYVVALLVMAYFSLAFLLDKYHVEIEHVTRPFMSKKK